MCATLKAEFALLFQNLLSTSGFARSALLLVPSVFLLKRFSRTPDARKRNHRQIYEHSSLCLSSVRLKCATYPARPDAAVQ